MLRRFAPPAMASAAAATARRMLNLHEHAAKELLKRAGCTVEEGYVCHSIDDVVTACAQLHTPKKVVKAQILAGGRGKGTFKDGFQSGVHVCADAATAVATAKKMLNNVLITKQTGPAGLPVKRLFVTETIPNIKQEMYVALMLDRKLAKPLLVACAEGGVNIEELAEKHPEKILKLPIPVTGALPLAEATTFAQNLGLKGETAVAAAKEFVGLVELARSNDATMVEINPMAVLEDGRVMCLDAKLSLDDNALYRHEQEWHRLEDLSQKDPKEVAADAAGLNYVALEGSVGCLVNGAGLAMATMDLIALHGQRPANFLDVGGGAKTDQIVKAFEIITRDPHVKCILVNIFGGIMKCDVIAQGIIEAAKHMGSSLKVPVVVRLEGTNDKEGLRLLRESGLRLISAADLDEAAELADREVDKMVAMEAKAAH